MKHGNKLIAFLLITLLCMMSFLPGAVWASTNNQPVDVGELTDEEIAKLRKSADALKAVIKGLKF